MFCLYLAYLLQQLASQGQRACAASSPELCSVSLNASAIVFCAAAGSLSVVEVGPKRVKFAAGAYMGTLETPEQMAVFLYYLDVSEKYHRRVCFPAP